MRAKPPGGLRLIATNRAANLRPSNYSGVQQITPAQDTFDGYTEVIASGSITEDIYRARFRFLEWGILATARDCLSRVSLGGNPWIPDLLHTGAGLPSASNTPGWVEFDLPIFGAKSQAIGVDTSVHSATLTAGRVIVDVYGRPVGGDVWAGSKVTALTSTPSVSAGTPVTGGTTSDGSWTELGTLTETCRFLDFGFGHDVTAMGGCHHVDIAIGDASNKRIVIEDALVTCNTIEVIGKPSYGVYTYGAPGEKVYGRIQTAASSGASMSLIAYCVS